MKFLGGNTMKYPVTLQAAEEGGFVVTFPDVPEAITQGDDLEQALSMAEDALVTAMDFYFEDNRPVPMPSKAKRNQHIVDLKPSIAAKVLLLNEMLQQKVSQVDLAKRLNTSPQAISRVVNLTHPTKIDALGDALKALGKDLVLQIA